MPLPGFISENLLPPIGHTGGESATAGPQFGPDSKLLNLPQTGQELAQWCFAAVSVAVKGFYTNSAISQCEIVSHVKGTSCCPADPNNSTCNAPDRVDTALDYVGHFDSFVDRPPAFLEEIVTQIDASQPIVIRVAPSKDASVGHFVAVMGYDKTHGITKVRVMNPNPVGRGSFADLDYSLFLSVVNDHTFCTHSFWTRA